jgi:hypothetical protein
MRTSLRILTAALAVVTLSLGTLAMAPVHDAPAALATTSDTAAAAAGPCSLQTFGSHQYRTCVVGHPAETALAAAPNGAVWALSAFRPQKSTDAGLTWNDVPLTPPNLGIGVVPEGDIIVAPNGDILVTWLSPDLPHTTPVWVSTNGGATFTFKPLTVPNPVPDRPWIASSATTPPNPSNPIQPNPYLSVIEGGIGVKLTYASGDRGTTWYPKSEPSLTPLAPFVPYPAGLSNPYLDFAKPLGQGFPSKILSLGNGQFFNIQSKRFSYDFVNWNTLDAAVGWPSPANFPWWDSASDGTLYAVQVVPVAGTWTVKYKWFDGAAWHDGATSVALSAQPDYLIGLTPTHVINAAVKSFGSTLGINTRQGTQDVLIRITNANTASASATKELIGPGSGARYDYPNLVFDSSGRAVTTYNSANVAYAQTV